MSGFKSTGMTVLKKLFSFGDKIRQDSSIKVLKVFENKILKMAQEKIKENHIPVKLEHIALDKDGECCIKADAVISKLDYTALVNRFLPEVVDAVSKHDSTGLVSDIAQILKIEQRAIVAAVLGNIEDAKKELIIKLLVKQYQATICKEMTKLISSSGVYLTVNGISVVSDLKL